MDFRGWGNLKIDEIGKQERRIHSHIKDSIYRLGEIYHKISKNNEFEFFNDELSVQFYLYGLFSQMRELVEFKSYLPERPGLLEILLYPETYTNEGMKWDFVIFSPKSIIKESPFIAIELKSLVSIIYKKARENVLKDLKKLSDKNIAHPIFIFIDYEHNNETIRFLKQHKSARTEINYITPDRVTIIR
jgi:hypothetical protein